jgi:cytochrome oxidase Cu insertion factor (SCO1/SenC/PrrC family)
MPRANRTGRTVARSPLGLGAVPERRPVWGRAATHVALAACLVLQLFGCPTRLPPAPAAPAVGQAAPDFALVDQRGETVRLQALRGAPVVLVFYRGFW